jgi:Putative Actinobacterial Holin-X, holin superfamily III
MEVASSETLRKDFEADGRPIADELEPNEPELRAFERQQASARTSSGRSASELLRQLIGDIAVLFRKELALAAAEVGQSVDEAKKGATNMVTGGAVLYAGLLFLLAAVALWISTILPAWVAVLIVGAATTVVGLIMVLTGKRKVRARSFAPNRTVDSLRKDTHAIRRQMQ